MADPTQQERPYDNLIDDLLLEVQARPDSWPRSRITAELLLKGVPVELAQAAADVAELFRG